MQAGMLGKATLAGGAVLLTLALLEWGIRLYIEHVADEATFVKYASIEQLQARKQAVDAQFKYTPHRYLGYYPTPNYRHGRNRHNALGFRGEEIVQPKAPGETRIACLGGSTTYTGFVDDYRQAYPYLLERILTEKGRNVSVINAGAGGWSSWESLINFEFRVLDLDPDIIIVYHGINDVHTRFVWPPGAYRPDNSGRRRAQSHIFTPRTVEQSALLRMLLVAFGVVQPQADISRSFSAWADTSYFPKWRRQKRRGLYPKGIFTAISPQQMFDANPPVYFRRNIENIIAIAKSRHIKTVLVTFAFAPGFPGQPTVSAPEYVAELDQTNEVLRSIAAQHDVSLVDLARIFPKRHDLFVDGRHVNEEGALLKARLIAQHLMALL